MGGGGEGYQELNIFYNLKKRGGGVGGPKDVKDVNQHPSQVKIALKIVRLCTD